MQAAGLLSLQEVQGEVEAISIKMTGKLLPAHDPLGAHHELKTQPNHTHEHHSIRRHKGGEQNKLGISVHLQSRQQEHYLCLINLKQNWLFIDVWQHLQIMVQ